MIYNTPRLNKLLTEEITQHIIVHPYDRELSGFLKLGKDHDKLSGKKNKTGYICYDSISKVLTKTHFLFFSGSTARIYLWLGRVR